MTPKLVDPYQGKEVGKDAERLANIEKRLDFIEGALSIHGTFMQVLKRFFEALPKVYNRAQSAQSEIKREEEGKAESEGKAPGGNS